MTHHIEKIVRDSVPEPYATRCLEALQDFHFAIAPPREIPTASSADPSSVFPTQQPGSAQNAAAD
jgi:hypothetical protein